ncbi:hypothetical protein RCL_jg10273.t2 [Rhizophagus clarus]|uniref:Uncharacterized protein n=1 Tax=Rhizophagus clarus TaxID=94130 RepID=A0A8H3KVF2_9GLOM|nr:hypothetical protein RCL_jg10273.t2 [Rhizophagus clarus]
MELVFRSAEDVAISIYREDIIRLGKNTEQLRSWFHEAQRKSHDITSQLTKKETEVKCKERIIQQKDEKISRLGKLNGRARDLLNREKVQNIKIKKSIENGMITDPVSCVQSRTRGITMNDPAHNISAVTRWFPGITPAGVIKKCNAYKLYRKPDKEYSMTEKTEIVDAFYKKYQCSSTRFIRIKHQNYVQLCFGSVHARDLIFNNDPGWTYEEDMPFNDRFTKVSKERQQYYIPLRRTEDIELSQAELATFGLTEKEWKEIVDEDKVTQKIRKGSELERNNHDAQSRNKKLKTREETNGQEVDDL